MNIPDLVSKAVSAKTLYTEISSEFEAARSALDRLVKMVEYANSLIPDDFVSRTYVQNNCCDVVISVIDEAEDVAEELILLDGVDDDPLTAEQVQWAKQNLIVDEHNLVYLAGRLNKAICLVRKESGA